MVDQEKITDFDRIVEELQRQIMEQERVVYSAKAIGEAYHPRNLGPMAEPHAYARVRGWVWRQRKPGGRWPKRRWISSPGW